MSKLGKFADSNVHITEHGDIRLRKRVGIKRKACLPHLQKVLSRGDLVQDSSEILTIKHGEFFYLFSVAGRDTLSFITVIFAGEAGSDQRQKYAHQ